MEDLHVGDEANRFIQIEAIDEKKINFSLLSGVESSVAADVKVRLKKDEMNEVESISLNGLEKKATSTFDMEYLEHLMNLDSGGPIDFHYNDGGAVRVGFQTEISNFTFLMAPMQPTKPQEEEEEEEEPIPAE